MSQKIEWIPAYSVGRDDLDAQHQVLFKLVDAISDQWDDKDLNSYVMKLFKYTREHFVDEEKILVAINYPQLDEHKKHHEDLISQLSDIGDW